MKTNIDQAVEILNEKFKEISDFRIYSDSNWTNGKICGGFYWMNYNNEPESKYPFHEVFMKGIAEWSIDAIVDYATSVVLKKLAWQKWSDEEYAKEFDKPVKYKYNYSAFGL